MRPLPPRTRSSKKIFIFESYILPGAIVLLLVSVLLFALSQTEASGNAKNVAADIGSMFPDKELFTLTAVDFGPDYPASNRNIDLQCNEFRVQNVTASVVNGAHVVAENLIAGRAQLRSAEVHQLRTVAVDTSILKAKQAHVDTMKVSALLFGSQGHGLDMRVFSMHPTNGIQYDNFELAPSPFSDQNSVTSAKRYTFGYALLDCYTGQVVLSRTFFSEGPSSVGSDALSMSQARFVSDLLFFRSSNDDGTCSGSSDAPSEHAHSNPSSTQNRSAKTKIRGCGPSLVLYGYGNEWYNYFDGCTECISLLVELGLVTISSRSNPQHAHAVTDSLVLRLLAARSTSVFLHVIGSGGNNRYESRQSIYNLQFPVTFPVFFFRDPVSECLLPVGH